VQKWPPHINLSWPFVPDKYFNLAAESIKANKAFATLVSSAPIRLRLERFAFTPGSKYVYLIPEIVEIDQIPNGAAAVKAPGAKPAAQQRKAKSAATASPPNNNPLATLQQIMLSEFPQCVRSSPEEDSKAKKAQHGKSSPVNSTALLHMTIGQLDQNTIEEEVKKLQESWTPIEFEIDGLSFIAREGMNDSFTVRHKLSFTSQ